VVKQQTTSIPVYNLKNKEKYNSELDRLLQESEEIKRIFGAISSKTKRKD
jgi:hypothetical protein